LGYVLRAPQHPKNWRSHEASVLGRPGCGRCGHRVGIGGVRSGRRDAGRNGGRYPERRSHFQRERARQNPGSRGIQDRRVASLRGVGKQIYDCNAGHTFTTPAREPAAGLFTSRGIPAGIHGKGPFWTNFDGSHVDGLPLDPTSASVPSPDPAPPAPAKNIAWLRLAATPTPNTTGVFSNVKFIQRIDTHGGVAPTSCTAPNTTLAVDYTANYVFWAPK
jgi:hypothetical protein